MRKTLCNYIKDNLANFYEFCYLEEGIYFINVEENHEIHRYILDDYVERVNNNGFFAGFLEINALSIILNISIARKFFLNFPASD